MAEVNSHRGDTEKTIHPIDADKRSVKLIGGFPVLPGSELRSSAQMSGLVFFSP
jgi:hypothetical protein